MSALRFIATSRPFQYTTLWRLPYLMIGLSFAGSVIENAWLLVFVQSDNSSCILHSTVSHLFSNMIENNQHMILNSNLEAISKLIDI